MSQTVTVQFVHADGTVDDDEWTAERVKFQMWGSGRAKVTLYRDGQVVEEIAYRRAVRIHRKREGA